jgi:hypothetical protein
VASTDRSYVPLTEDDLKELKKYGIKEHEEFFKRNQHLKNAYGDSLIGICLSQGAASYYLNPKVGIKDFDIWHFYMDKGSSNFPYRSRKTVENCYKGKPIDFLKRAIPKYVCDSYLNDPEQIILRYLLGRNTKTKNLLLEKAVIGLYPDKIFGKVLWKGRLCMHALQKRAH